MMGQGRSPEVTEVRGDLERMPFGAPADEVAAAVSRDGGVILTGALTRGEVDAVNASLDPHFAALSVGNFSDGEDNFVGEFHGRTTKRLMHCVKHSRMLREAFLNHEALPGYLAALLPGALGSHTMYASQAIEIHPGEKAQTLHRDGGGLMALMGTEGPAGLNLMVNTLLALTEVTEEMGATRVIPGSPAWSDYDDPGAQDQTIPATLRAGDLLMINGKILHGGGANVTKDRARRVLSTSFTPGVIRGEEAWPHVISVEEVRNYPKRLQGYLGFRSISYRGEQPGFLWRVDTRPLEESLAL